MSAAFRGAATIVPLTRPTFTNGAWNGAALSGRGVSYVRRQFLLEGLSWTYQTPKKPPKLLKFKGHKRDRIAVDRAEKIKANMAAMPKKLEEYYAQLRAKRVRMDVASILSAGALTSEQALKLRAAAMASKAGKS